MPAIDDAPELKARTRSILQAQSEPLALSGCQLSLPNS